MRSNRSTPNRRPRQLSLPVAASPVASTSHTPFTFVRAPVLRPQRRGQLVELDSEEESFVDHSSENSSTEDSDSEASDADFPAGRKNGIGLRGWRKTGEGSERVRCVDSLLCGERGLSGVDG